MTRMRRTLAVVAVVAGLVTATGCSQSPFADDSFEERIPAALLESDLGIVEASADKGVDGLTDHVWVIAEFDHPELTTEEVAEFVTLIAQHNTVRVRYLLLSPSFEREEIDIAPQLEELGAEPWGETRLHIDLDEAVAIAKEHDR